jgi:uncharacterized damage-inducible protein DinB
MTTQSPQPSTPAEGLAVLDAARDEFLSEFAQAPDAALAHVPTGEEYALGGLLVHLCDPIDRYLDVFGRMLGAGFGPVDVASDPEYQAREAARHAAVVSARPTSADRPGLLVALGAAHERVRSALGALDSETFVRQAPVVYSAGTEAYPTSARDILGWLTDHYREHTAQVATMLAGWGATSPR